MQPLLATVRPVQIQPLPPAATTLARTLPTLRRGRPPAQRVAPLGGGLPPVCAVPAVTVEPLPGMPVTINRRERERITAQAHQEEEKLPAAEIQGNLISLFSFEELKQIAVVEVNNPGESGPNSVADPRMSPREMGELCDTCHKDIVECPGHLGYIKFNKPIYHPLYIRIIIQVLTCVCNSCGGLLLTRTELEEKGILKKSGPNRLKLIEEACTKINVCANERRGVERPPNTRSCTPNPTYKFRRETRNKQIWYSYPAPKGEKEHLEIKPIQEVEKILLAISPEDAELLGFKNNSHPSRMILRAFPVIPPLARPHVVQDGIVMEDNLTSMYRDIINDNNRIITERSEEKTREALENLFFHVEHFIDNTDGKYSRGHRGEYKSIKERITGKEEIIRGMLMGKRVNYSARTVISPDPSLKFGQIRVPKAWASILTQPEKVTTFNKERLTKLLREGKITHITRGSGPFRGRRFKVLDHTRQTEELVIGDTVDRWLQNGDYVLANRQPTVHKQGFMGQEVVLGDEDTIGLHLSVTTPYNADFKPLKSTGSRSQR